MTTFYYGPALDSELDYRRHALQHDAQVDRLVRDARLFARAARAATQLPACAPLPRSGSPKWWPSSLLTSSRAG